ncbi:hypothetical protein [Maribacter luteus]|uniref:Uncharacterized protein n=1 Tax=Maribacter luteus TaxID=2594478 RepID=A0A6I2MLR4_9FLAO|nr:hypothetical protein [Maribacter luteus]MRX64773.1 hypothetical protein [Maribacter luteus]
MKKILPILGLAFLMSCITEKESKNNFFNPFKTSTKLEIQFFDLDTIGSKEIIGEKGTRIYFVRENFDIDSTDKITMELKEFYSISDLLKNNIRTVTKDNELLESSGVIYLNFKSNGEDLKLRDSSTIRVRFPIDFSNKDKIFTGQMDSISQMSWSETEAYFMVLRFDKKYQIYVGYDVTLDSLPYYQELWRKEDSIYKKTIGSLNKIDDNIGTSISLTNLGWINVDRFIEKPTVIDLDMTNALEVDGIVIYVIYENFNSFTSFYPSDTKSIIQTEIPILENTSIIAVGIKDEQLYAQKIPIKDDIEMKLGLKPINRAELNRLFEK